MNGYSNFRYSVPYTIYSDTYTTSTTYPSTLPALVLYVTGGPASSNIGNISINYTYEFTPTAA